ncbi:hypothetical protein UCREL1_1462 [Eutypa lata UCREL1]|uniref:Uncharacterized protein n=1 Tax=Eutypa lata (strain UCR-EL1) TaxID=1287681 RepID=M7TXW2_EUTLA|nr:hypothetical protein UCREL1_1462 [Eutypa lata UCREL1]
MRFFAFASATFAILGMAAATPFTSPNDTPSPFYVRRACDCPGVRACCQDCIDHSDDWEHCCNVDCMAEFPGCVAAC